MTLEYVLWRQQQHNIVTINLSCLYHHTWPPPVHIHHSLPSRQSSVVYLCHHWLPGYISCLTLTLDFVRFHHEQVWRFSIIAVNCWLFPIAAISLASVQNGPSIFSPLVVRLALSFGNWPRDYWPEISILAKVWNIFCSASMGYFDNTVRFNLLGLNAYFPRLYSSRSHLNVRNKPLKFMTLINHAVWTITGPKKIVRWQKFN